jgi:Icc-related predicted phosphoesterase
MTQEKYLIAISDTHGNNEALGKISGNLRSLLQKYDKPLENCMLLYIGDALPLEKVNLAEAKQHYKDFTDALARAELPVAGVGGNHDLEDEMRAAFEEKGWPFLHGDTVEYHGIKIAGYGGCPVPDTELSEKIHGISADKFVQYDDRELITKLKDSDATIFLHHVPPHNFADTMVVGFVDTPRGRAAVAQQVGGRAIGPILGNMNPSLDLSGHIHESTASTTEQRTVFIKCHGFQEEYNFPVYYAELAYDEDGKPYVKSNVDISFALDDFGQILPRPIVTCREEYECNSEEMVHHYRVFKKDDMIIRTIKTDNGFKQISQKPALAGSDDISWAFASEKGSGGIILL